MTFIHHGRQRNRFWPLRCGPLCCGPQEEFFIKFAEFEEKAREVERARAIYRYALDHIPKVRGCRCAAECNIWKP